MNIDEQANSEVYKKSGRKVAGRFGKGDVRYWKASGKKRLFKENRGRNYSCRIQFAGERLRFNTGTSNKERAAEKAVAIYNTLMADGVEAAREAFKPKMAERSDVETVGQWIEAVEAHCTLYSATMQNYVSAVRKLAGDIGALPKNKARFSYRDGGTKEWREAVDKLPLRLLDSANVNAWQVAYRKDKDANPEAQRRALNSARSTVRNAKALFAEKHAKTLKDVAKLTLPEPLPMSDVSVTELFGKKAKTCYQSRIDAERLIAKAGMELAGTEPEAFKVFVLALCCGLRKREIDCLLWHQVDLDKGVIRIEATEHFRPKSEDSAGEVDLDAEVVALLRGWKGRANGDFVIEGREQATFKSRVSYRCESVFATLNAWLRKNGVKSQKPLHELRKEAGALVAKTAGIYAASRLLRHADIRVTANFYADKKERISTGLGGLLPAAENVIEFSQATPAATSKDRSRRA